jgi:hypothetical protein
VLAIDRMDFAGGARIFIDGATHAPQPAPFKPQIQDFFDEFSTENWKAVSGEWRVSDNQIISESSEKSELLCQAQAKSFLCETWAKAFENESGSFGVCLKNEETDVFKFLLAPDAKQAFAVWIENGVEQIENFALAADFDFQAFHLLRVEKDCLRLKVSLDENTVRFEKILENFAPQISLLTESSTAAFSGFALSVGFEDLFENSDLEKRGWRKIPDGGEWRIEDENLVITSRTASETILCKETPPGDFELALNFRLLEIFHEDFRIGFYPAFEAAAGRAFFSISKTNENWILKVESGGETRESMLPQNFSPDVFRQFRFLKIGEKIVLQLEAETLGVIDAPTGSGKIALSVRNASIAFDMARFTVL